MPAKKPFDEWVGEANAVHGNLYRYDRDSYTGTNKKVRIECQVHGWFVQIGAMHTTRGTGCPKCAAEARGKKQWLGVEGFVVRATRIHGDQYDYSAVEYVDSATKVAIRCCEHGVFLQRPCKHLRGHGCPKCGKVKRAISKTFTSEKFTSKAAVVHGGKYDYSSVKYKGMFTCVEVTCKKHGGFLQTPDGHLAGKGCPRCAKQLSKAEDEIAALLNPHTKVVQRSRKVLGGGKEVDIYLPDRGVAVEYNGLYWHSSRTRGVNYHLDKTSAAESAGVRLIHIFEDEWANRRSAVENLLKSAAGVSVRRFARRLEVRTVEVTPAAEFLDTHHIQGRCRGSHRYGLYDGNELMAVMMFGVINSVRGTKAAESVGHWELLRYASNGSVVGGASKLFAAFVRDHKPASVISYSERRLFTGRMYQKLGFALAHYTRPSYWVVDGGIRRHKANFKKDRLKALLGDKFDAAKTERQMCEDLKLYRIYDCGLAKWIWERDVGG